MSKKRSLPRFYIGLSAAALLTLGLAGQAQSESRIQSVSSIQATFQGLADAIEEHQAWFEEAGRREAEEPRPKIDLPTNLSLSCLQRRGCAPWPSPWASRDVTSPRW